jgi:7-alpha-hydroxysteroid dehydrogenase
VGLGAAAAVALAQAGPDVVIARSANQLATVAAQVEAVGHRALVVPADLSDLDAAAGLAAAAADAFGRLDIVLTDDGLRGQMERATPLHRIGDPQEVAAAVVFLASPASGYITGKILEVDGIDRPNLDLGIPDL